MPPKVQFSDSLLAAIEGVKAVLVLTRWDEFKELPNILARRADAPFVIDGRRMLDRATVKDYAGIGA